MGHFRALRLRVVSKNTHFRLQKRDFVKSVVYFKTFVAPSKKGLISNRNIFVEHATFLKTRKKRMLT